MEVGVESAIDVEADVVVELVVALRLDDGEHVAAAKRVLEEEVVGVGAALVVELDESGGIARIDEREPDEPTVALAAVVAEDSGGGAGCEYQGEGEKGGEEEAPRLRGERGGTHDPRR